MHLSVLLALWGIVALGIYKALSIVVENRRHAAKAKELGCQDAPLHPNCGFLGLKQVRRMQKADKTQLFPDLLLEQQEEMTKFTGRVCSTFRTQAMGQTIHFTSDPKNIQAMLATQFNDYSLGPSRRQNMIATLGDGIFVQDGKKWEHSRAMLRPNFVRDKVSDLELEEHHVQNLMKVMPVQSDGWTAEVAIQTLFFRLTIDSACEFLFGASLNSQLVDTDLAVGKNDERAFSRNFDSAQMHLARRFRLADMFWLHNPKEFRDNNKVVNEFARHYVNLVLQKKAGEKKEEDCGMGKEKYVFLEALAEQTRDPEELRAQLLNILLAGRDTTASLLSWLFHQLLRHPEVFDKLRAAILETFGPYDDPNITFSTLKGCSYLQNCLSEILRLWTVVPGNARRTNKPTTLPRGGGPDGESPIYLRAQVDVGYSIHVMHRRKDLWGQDADEFRPERFEGRRPGWEFLPFNGGPRICIGQQFALTEAAYVVVRLLQRFDKIDARPEELQGLTTSNLTLTSAPGRLVTLRLREAKN